MYNHQTVKLIIPLKPLVSGNGSLARRPRETDIVSGLLVGLSVVLVCWLCPQVSLLPLKLGIRRIFPLNLDVVSCRPLCGNNGEGKRWREKMFNLNSTWRERRGYI